MHKSGALPALRRAAPLYCGLILACGVLFQPNGLTAAQVVKLTRESPWARVLLWGGWLLLTAPVARVVLQAPHTRLLRALPVPFLLYAIVQGAWLALAELPPLIIALRGAGRAAWLGAPATLCFAMGAHALWVSPPHKFDRQALALALLLSAAWPSLPSAGVLLLGGAALGMALPTTLRRAQEIDQRPSSALGRLLSRLPPPLSLALAHSAALLRTDAPTLLRALLLTGLSAGVAVLAARSNQVSGIPRLARLSLGVAALPLSLAASGIAGPLLRGEERLRWLLRSAGLGGDLQALATLLPLVLVLALCGGLHGALLALAVGSPLRLSLDGALYGAAIAALQLRAARFALRGDDKDGERGFLAAFTIALLLSIAAYVFSELLLALLLPLSAAVTLRGAGGLALATRRPLGQPARDTRSEDL